ncbi:MAG: helix-turn-helix transcriptional regulator [Terriglobales bacterium]
MATNPVPAAPSAVETVQTSMALFAPGCITRQSETHAGRLREVVVRSRGLHTAWHRHALPYFALTLNGIFTQTFARTSVACRPGTLIYHLPGELHADHFLSSEVRILQIEPAGDDSGRGVPGEADLASPRLSRVARDLYRELRHADEHSPLAMEGLVLQMLALVRRARPQAAGMAAPPWLTQACQTLAIRFAEHLSLAMVAAAAEVHPTHLAREFRRYEGCTVGQRLRQIRTAYACRQLEQTQISLAEIALAAGFADQSHLTRVFRGLLGLTPLQYRRGFRPPHSPA